METLNNGSLVDKIQPLPKDGKAVEGTNHNILGAGWRKKVTKSKIPQNQHFIFYLCGKMSMKKALSESCSYMFSVGHC